jgi:hypothetical protein
MADIDFELSEAILEQMRTTFSNHDNDLLFDHEGWPKVELMSEAIGRQVSVPDMAAAFPEWTRIRSEPIPAQEWDADEIEEEVKPQPKQTTGGLWASDPHAAFNAAEAEAAAARVDTITKTHLAYLASTKLNEALGRWQRGAGRPQTPLEQSRAFARTSQLERATLAAQGIMPPDCSRSKSARPNSRGAFPSQFMNVKVAPGQRYR